MTNLSDSPLIGKPYSMWVDTETSVRTGLRRLSYRARVYIPGDGPGQLKTEQRDMPPDEWRAMLDAHYYQSERQDGMVFFEYDDPATDNPASRWDVYGEPAL